MLSSMSEATDKNEGVERSTIKGRQREKLKDLLVDAGFPDWARKLLLINTGKNIFGGRLARDALALKLRHERVLRDTESLKREKDYLQKQSREDPKLKGVLNAKAIDEELREEFYRSKMVIKEKRKAGGPEPLTVIMLDLDDFKEYNDTHGHVKGDEALRHLTDIIEEVLKRPTDKFGRFGGEEFLLVLPETELLPATVLAETLRIGLGRSFTKKLNIPSFTISLGVAEISSDFKSHKDMIDAADMAMYNAKQAGRNRTAFVDEAGDIAVITTDL